MQAVAEILEQEMQMCKDILELEYTAGPEAELSSSIKWPTLTLAQLKDLLLTISQPGDSPDIAHTSALYQRLQDIDPLRTGFYQDASQGSAKILVQSAG